MCFIQIKDKKYDILLIINNQLFFISIIIFGLRRMGEIVNIHLRCFFIPLESLNIIEEISS